MALGRATEGVGGGGCRYNGRVGNENFVGGEKPLGKVFEVNYRTRED